MAATSDLVKVQTEARNLVTRSRLGDENAVAMLVMIRNSAAQGSRKAIYTLKYLKEYIKKHPVLESCKIGFGCNPITQRVINAIHSKISGEPRAHANVMVAAIPKIESPVLAAVPMANNGSLLGQSNPRIIAICKFFGDSEMDAFEFGKVNCFTDTAHINGELSEGESKALHIGKTVGIAQRIQAVRNNDAPISSLSKMASWELGE